MRSSFPGHRQLEQVTGDTPGGCGGWGDEKPPCSCPAPPCQVQLSSQDSGSLSSTYRQLNATVSCSRPCDSKTTPLNRRHNNNHNKDSASREAHQSCCRWQADPELSYLHDLRQNLPCSTSFCILTTSSLASWPCQSFPTSLAVARSSCTSPIVLLAPYPSASSSDRRCLFCSPC